LYRRYDAGVYNFYKTRMPPAVATFLLTLATVDDLGAIAVIAVFFAKGIVPSYLVASAGICVVGLYKFNPVYP
jgi:NhaA family Na+:H+ antiporter